MDAPVRLINLEVTPDGIAERSGSERVAFVPNREIERLEVAHGFVAERQLVQLIVAALLMLAGAYLMVMVAAASPRALLLGPALIVFGLLALVASLRRGPHLRIETARGVRKLRLHSAPDVLAQQAFLVEARRLLAF